MVLNILSMWVIHAVSLVTHYCGLSHWGQDRGAAEIPGFHKNDIRGSISLDPHCCCSLWEIVCVYLSFLHIRLKLSRLFILPQGTAQNMKVLLQYIRWNSNSYQHLLKYLLLNASCKSLSYVASWNEGVCYTEQDFHRQLLVNWCQEKVDL